MKTKQEFIIDTLKPYFENRELCAVQKESGGCMYLTEDGRKCAAGRHMKEGPWQNARNKKVSQLFDSWNLEDMFTEEAMAQNLTIEEWDCLQDVHDAWAYYSEGDSIDRVKRIIGECEDMCGVNLAILKNLVK